MHKRGQADVCVICMAWRLTNAGGTADSLIRPGIQVYCVPGFNIAKIIGTVCYDTNLPIRGGCVWKE
jgi:hypothetical protein